MVKAWDMAALGEELKAQGLDLAEDAVKHVVEAVFNWSEKSIDLTEMKFDDLAKPFLPQLKAAALGLADKIDNEVG